MQNKMATRRCIKGQIPCQQMNNIFIIRPNQHLALIPQNIWKLIPNTQKVSCQILLKNKEIFPIKSNQETLKEIKDNVKLQLQQINRIFGQVLQPDNALNIEENKPYHDIQNDIKAQETPIRKIVKRDNCTREVSDYESDHCKGDDIFVDEKVIEKLEDYLSID